MNKDVKRRSVWRAKLSYLGFLFLVLFLVAALGGREVQAKAKGQSKWTVLIYLCGSDLESVSAMATQNLIEMAQISLPLGTKSDDVKVVIQTGGCKKWHAKKELGLSISTQNIGRYRFFPAEASAHRAEFLLLEEVGLTSMGEEDTLKDFIRWGKTKYPAEKYLLFFWDHGGGSKSGLMQDELFNNDILMLYELGEALKSIDLHFELIVMDACMMASLETVQTIKDYASYFVGSETLVPGQGGGLGQWLSEMYINPDCDGREAGRIFCDKTLRKYSFQDKVQQSKLMAWSLIDLGKVDAVSACFDDLFDHVVEWYKNSPEYMENFSLALDKAVHYGLDDYYMVDLGSFFDQPEMMQPLTMNLRNRMFRALSECVIYCVKGIGMADSSGLSFCYGGWLEEEEIPVYVKNCHCIPYLTFLDALYEWNPEEDPLNPQERLEPLGPNNKYAVQIIATSFRDLPCLKIIDSEYRQYLGKRTRVKLFRDQGPGKWEELFTEYADLVWDGGSRILVPPLTKTHPSLFGELVDVKVVQSAEDKYLYNIPISYMDKVYYLRVYWDKSEGRQDKFEFIGIWEDYDETREMPSRNVLSLLQVVGREMALCYSVYGKNYNATGGAFTVVKGMEIEESPLPPGTYYLEYTIANIFGREYTLPLLKTTWDGENFHTDEDDMYLFLDENEE
ncbi:MAG: hypothetical protein IIZ39_10815 [Blautia sp.]|nr:hypothetical protein [Blautia sp.]